MTEDKLEGKNSGTSYLQTTERVLPLIVLLAGSILLMLANRFFLSSKYVFLLAVIFPIVISGPLYAAYSSKYHWNLSLGKIFLIVLTVSLLIGGLSYLFVIWS